MFHVDHLCSDGIGIRILAHHFFWLLAAELGATSDRMWREINWQRNAEHLPPPWTDLMNNNQRTNGASFDEVVHRNLAILLDASVRIGPSE